MRDLSKQGVKAGEQTAAALLSKSIDYSLEIGSIKLADTIHKIVKPFLPNQFASVLQTAKDKIKFADSTVSEARETQELTAAKFITVIRAFFPFLVFTVSTSLFIDFSLWEILESFVALIILAFVIFLVNEYFNFYFRIWMETARIDSERESRAIHRVTQDLIKLSKNQTTRFSNVAVFLDRFKEVLNFWVEHFGNQSQLVPTPRLLDLLYNYETTVCILHDMNHATASGTEWPPHMLFRPKWWDKPICTTLLSFLLRQGSHCPDRDTVSPSSFAVFMSFFGPFGFSTFKALESFIEPEGRWLNSDYKLAVGSSQIASDKPRHIAPWLDLHEAAGKGLHEDEDHPPGTFRAFFVSISAQCDNSLPAGRDRAARDEDAELELVLRLEFIDENHHVRLATVRNRKAP
jgi:hypothetical protein